MTYEIAKSLHIIAIIAWMAAMLYLPRLFVYHAQISAGSQTSETFKIMERRLLRFIMTPGMLASWATGLWVAYELGVWTQGWLHTKITLVVILSGLHGMMAVQVKRFAADANRKSARYFKIINEVPTVLLIAIVFLVVLKPF